MTDTERLAAIREAAAPFVQLAQTCHADRTPLLYAISYGHAVTVGDLRRLLALLEVEEWELLQALRSQEAAS